MSALAKGEQSLDAGRPPADDGRLGRALYLAASNGFEGVFRVASAEAGARGTRWWEGIPMDAAARGGSVPIGEALLAHGAAVGGKNLYGITPLHVAAENGRLAFVEFLVRSGAELEEASVQGWTALHFARENGHDSVAARLLALGASDRPAVFPELRGPWLGQPEPGELQCPAAWPVAPVRNERHVPRPPCSADGQVVQLGHLAQQRRGRGGRVP